MNLDYSLLIPEYILAVGAALVTALGLTLPRSPRLLPCLTALTAVATAVVSALYIDVDKDFGGLVSVDDYTSFYRVFCPRVTTFVAITSAQFADARIVN